MFSKAVLDHFRNPRNAGDLAGATAIVEVSNPACGDVLRLAARVENGRILETRFLCRGCATSIACASFLTEQVSGRTLAEAQSLTQNTLSEALGGLPAHAQPIQWKYSDPTRRIRSNELTATGH
jgi:NifU-like protein involved in Fe-S cluster formation